MFLSRLFLATTLCVSGSTLFAHEFWIEPQKFQVETGENLTVDLKNGQKFVGGSLSYFPSQFSRFEMAQGNQIKPVDGRAGDSPALAATTDQDGLLVVLHETTPNRLKYKEWDKFLKFVEHKNFKNAVADHDAAGWPREDFWESYTRHVKALIAVGSGEGADQNYGMTTEFVALTNPYTNDFDGTMRVKVLFENTPRPDVQVEVFERAPDDSVEITLFRTNANGVAAIPVKPAHTYLFDAVVLRPHPGDEKSIWQTFWAALAFEVPN